MNESAMVIRDDDPVTLQAIDWLLRLSDEQARAEDVAEWQRWLAASPVHRATFERAQAVWGLVPLIEPVPWPTDWEVAKDSYKGNRPISQVRRAPRRWSGLALAACVSFLTAATGVAWYVSSGLDRPVLRTEIGENREFALEDGSRVTLGGASRVREQMTAGTRDVELESGEAFFEVKKDAARPFVVRAGNARITAIGTAFNVRRAEDLVNVAVASGIVRIEAVDATSPDAVANERQQARLEAGHQAVVVAGSLLPSTLAPVPMVLARKEGRLQYTSEPLRYVIADLSRYSTVPIEIEGARTGELAVTGTVLRRDLEGWLRGLEQAMPVTVTFGEERIVIRTR